MRLKSWLANLCRRVLNPIVRTERICKRHRRLSSRSSIVEFLEPRRLLSGQTITVDVLNDGSVPGHTTLRDAIATANSEPGGGDTIAFDVNLAGTITLTQGELAITNSMTIAGPGSSVLAISGNNASRIFDISSNSALTVSISGLTLTDGNCATSAFQAGLGGAIYNSESLTLSNNLFANNTANDGGAVLNAGNLVSSFDAFNDNSATIYGGGVYNGGTFTATNDTWSGNNSPNGGAVENQNVMTVTSSTFTNNSATVQGGAIDNEATLTSTGNAFNGNTAANIGGGGAGGAVYNTVTWISTNDTLFGNTAANGAAVYSAHASFTSTHDTIAGNVGKGIVLQQGTWNSLNTIVTGNVFSTGSNTPSDITNNGATINAFYTLIGDANSAGGIVNGTNHNLVGVATNAVLMTDQSGNPLIAENGGPTQTIALVAGGPAVGVAGSVAKSTIDVDNSSLTLTIDQSTFLAAGDLLRIGSEIVTVTSVTDSSHITVQRGTNGTVPASHSANTPIYLAFDQTGALRVNYDLGAKAEINHAPTGTSSTVATFENKPYVIKVTDLGFADSNDTPSNTLLAVKITTLPTSGTLWDNGVAVTTGQFVSVTDINNGKLIYTPQQYFVGGPILLCQFQVQDNGGAANGGNDLDPTARDMSISIAHVNQAPVGTSGTVATAENLAYMLKTSDFGFTDPHDSPANSLLAVKITTPPSLGTLVDNGVTVTAGQLISAADISSGKLVFTPKQGLTSGTYFLCKFQVRDNGGTANGGVDLDPTARVLYVNLVHVNHAPVGTNGTVSAVENKPYTLKTTDFGFSDPNDSPSNSLLAVKFTTLPTSGTLTDNGVALTANQFVSASDIAAGKLVFTPKTDLSGGPFFLSKFQVQDNGGTAFGGINLDSTARVLYVNIAHVNHAPVGTSGTVSASQNTPYKLKVSDFGFTDPNDVPANTLMAVKFTTLPTAGTLTDNGVAVTAGQFVSVADITSGKLVFTPKTNLTDGPYFLCKFQVQDNGGTANGGNNLDATAKVLYVSILH